MTDPLVTASWGRFRRLCLVWRRTAYISCLVAIAASAAIAALMQERNCSPPIDAGLILFLAVSSVIVALGARRSASSEAMTAVEDAFAVEAYRIPIGSWAFDVTVEDIVFYLPVLVFSLLSVAIPAMVVGSLIMMLSSCT